MPKLLLSRSWVVAAAGAAVALVLLVAGGFYVVRDLSPAPASAGEPDSPEETPEVVRVEVVRPEKGGMDHTTTQPGTVEPFDVEHIVPQATGKLEVLNVDIGWRVKKGQVLAKIAVPDLEAEVERQKAGMERAKALVDQMTARVTTAEAELEAAKAGVNRALANARSTAAALRYRQSLYERYKGLLVDKSIDPKTVDEERERRDAALELKNAADEAVITSRANVAASAAKIKQAQADLDEAHAEVDVSKARLHAAEVAVGFATIRSDYDGVVTQRSKLPGDFIRSGSTGVARPLLTVQRTDKFRVVVQVPDQDVPYVDEGDPAVIEISSLPGIKLKTQKVPGHKQPQPIVVSRLAESEDPQTRLMRVEIDLYNPDGKIKAGMFGNVTIILDRSNLLSLPSSAVFNRKSNGRAEVFVVRDGRAYRKPVLLGGDNGVRVAIRSGLNADDQVVLRPGGLEEGQPVTVVAPPEVHAAATAPR